MNDFDYLLELPGEERERHWLQERLETLSVREGTILAAAVMRSPPEDMVQAINCLQSLDSYHVRVGTGSYEALGDAYLRNGTNMPKDALPFVDLEQMGQWYEDKHPGLFVGSYYVEYPKDPVQPVYHGRDTPLPEDDDWSVKLKAASPAVPEGMWLRLPGPFSEYEDGTVEEVMALQELGINHWYECTLLDARCILPEAGNLMEQYNDVGDLIYDAIELGYILDQKGQGTPCFTQRYAAALELEHCRNLRLAMDISQNLGCYDWSPSASLETAAMEALLAKGVSEELIRASGLDLAGYQAHLLEQEGHMLTPDEGAYIRRNDKEFRYTYSTPTPEQSGMMMQ